MKKNIIFCLCIAVITLFVACNKDQEGVYNPSKKIQKVYTLDENDIKELEEVWTWDGKLLTQIEFVDDNYPSTTRFSYDNKKRLVSIDDEESHSEVFYDGKYIQKIVITSSGSEVGTIEFTHENGKINLITMNGLDDLMNDLDFKSSPMRFVLPDVYPVVEKAMKQCSKEAKGTPITMKLNWSGDNVGSLEMTIPMPIIGNLTQTTTFTYDNKKNPMYGLLTAVGNAITVLFTNKNNILTSQTTAMGSVYESATFTYEYEGDYPKIVTCVSTIDDDFDVDRILYEY